MSGLGDFSRALLANDAFLDELTKDISLRLNKADTFTQATGIVWYDLSHNVQLLVPDTELFPLISRLPRVPANGGTAHHWKRITDINATEVSGAVSEGNRGAREVVTEQDQVAIYKTSGFEGSTTWEARLAARNLNPDPLGIVAIATLANVRIFEEKVLVLGNASTPLGLTPLPALAASGTTGAWGGTVTVYVRCVALSGFGYIGYTPYISATGAGGIPSQVTKVNADGSTDTFGGGSAKPSNEASLAAVTTAQVVTATVVAVPAAIAYAWYVGTSSGGETLAAITGGPQAIFTKIGAYGVSTGTSQPITALQVGGVYQDNSTNNLTADGIISQMSGQVAGPGFTTTMGTNPVLPVGVTTLPSGSLLYTMATGNTGLTCSGTNVTEFDQILQAGYDQYKIGFQRILMSSSDLLAWSKTMFAQGANLQFRMMFDVAEENGRIIAGRRITGYSNKLMNTTLDVEVHPFLPPGNVLFWSDRMPYRLSNVANPLEIIVRQDYFAIDWPQRTRRYEYGVYVDETVACNLTPAFALIQGLNPTTGTPSF